MFVRIVLVVIVLLVTVFKYKSMNSDISDSYDDNDAQKTGLSSQSDAPDTSNPFIEEPTAEDDVENTPSSSPEPTNRTSISNGEKARKHSNRASSRPEFGVDSIQFMKKSHTQHAKEGNAVHFDIDGKKRSAVLGDKTTRTIHSTEFSDPRPPLYHSIVSFDSPISKSLGVDGLTGTMKDKMGRTIVDEFNAPVRVIVYTAVVYSTTIIQGPKKKIVSNLKPGNVISIRVPTSKNKEERFMIVNTNPSTGLLAVMGSRKFPLGAVGNIQRSVRGAKSIIVRDVKFGVIRKGGGDTDKPASMIEKIKKMTLLKKKNSTEETNSAETNFVQQPNVLSAYTKMRTAAVPETLKLKYSEDHTKHTWGDMFTASIDPKVAQVTTRDIRSSGVSDTHTANRF